MLYCPLCMPISICWYFESTDFTNSIFGFKFFHRILADKVSILSGTGENQTIIIDKVKASEINFNTFFVLLFSLSSEQMNKKNKRKERLSFNTIKTFKRLSLLTRKNENTMPRMRLPIDSIMKTDPISDAISLVAPWITFDENGNIKPMIKLNGSISPKDVNSRGKKEINSPTPTFKIPRIQRIEILSTGKTIHIAST